MDNGSDQEHKRRDILQLQKWPRT